MTEQSLSKAFIPVNEQARRVRYVEIDSRIVVPDRSFSKAELTGKFRGLDVESLTQGKLRELGFIPRNEMERRMLEFLHNPLIHRYSSGDSPARYFMEVIMGDHAILASYLPPNTVTSKHPHSDKYGILEDYHPIGGKSKLILGGETRDLKLGTVQEVPFNTYHQMKAEEEPAFTLIIMKNAARVPRENWHR